MYKINFENILGALIINKGFDNEFVAKVYKNNELLYLNDDDKLIATIKDQTNVYIDKKEFTLIDDLSLLSLNLSSAECDLEKKVYQADFILIRAGKQYLLNNINIIKVA